MVQLGVDGLRLVYLDVEQADEQMLEFLYATVLQPAFPPAELVTLDELRNWCAAGPPARRGLLLLESDRPVAAILAEYFRTSDVLLISYLAVAAAWRGRGFGAALVREALSRWDSPPPVAVLAEVEDPRWHPLGRYVDPVARLRFYHRLGARALPIPYFQPALRPGSPRVPGLLLVSLPAGRRTVPWATVGGFLNEYFAACEGSTGIGDAQLQALRSSLSPTGDVKLIPLDWINIPRARSTLLQIGAQR